MIPESFVSAEIRGEELDSLATWPAEDGHTWLIATAKTSHRLLVFDADSGALLRTFGFLGKGTGEFRRPNGVAVHGDLLFVVERDNRRVQTFRLPGFTPAGTFGTGQLRSPYGLWVQEIAPGELEVFVTDSFMYGERYDVVPPFEELDQRVRRFRVTVPEDRPVQARYAGSFGDTHPDTALRMVESIAGDPANGRLLIADEDRRHHSTLREYTLEGRYTGRQLPESSFGAEAEGIALWQCQGDAGYWIVVDQLAPRAVFHVFDRNTLRPVGSFRGEVTAYTDGIALHAATTAAFPTGALFAVHDDKAVAAFDLQEVARVFDLPAGCTR
ncbi:3-phytase [Lysobacter ruishenii]|uniref:3-phytase n=1 Tax=Aerolutibacter ruishenii TaxID=686800 RepID=A0A562LP88_9GAMM|nr:3-phytase [Lysobacter ruishenii]